MSARGSRSTAEGPWRSNLHALGRTAYGGRADGGMFLCAQCGGGPERIADHGASALWLRHFGVPFTINGLCADCLCSRIETMVLTGVFDMSGLIIMDGPDGYTGNPVKLGTDRALNRQHAARRGKRWG